MAVQTVPQTRSTRLPGVSPRPDPVLEEAVARITELTRRLRSVGSVHAPQRTRFSGRPRCAACGAPSPCPTLLAAGLAPLPDAAGLEQLPATMGVPGYVDRLV